MQLLQRAITYVKEGSVYYTIEYFDHSGKKGYHLLEIERKKQELFINREETVASLGDIASSIQKNAAVFLVVNTDKVLTKIVPTSTASSAEALVHSSFPNIDFESFVYQVTTAKVSNIISLCKKQQIEDYIEAFREQQINVSYIGLGISALPTLLDQVEGDRLVYSGATVALDDHIIVRMAPVARMEMGSGQRYKINGVQVEHSSLLGFSQLLAHFLGKGKIASNFLDTQAAWEKEFRNRRYFSLGSKSALAFILVLLLTNFLVFNHYHQNVIALQESIALNSADTETLVQLRESVLRKEEKVKTVLSAANSRTSYFLNQMTIDMPASILLDEITYQPLLKPLRAAKPIEQEGQTILVSGKTSDSDAFQTWVASLGKLSWIGKIETIDYDYNSGNSSNFSVKIYLDE